MKVIRLFSPLVFLFLFVFASPFVVFGNEFVWAIFPAEQFLFSPKNDLSNGKPIFLGVGKLYISINSKKGEFNGLRYQNEMDHTSKLDFVFSEFVIETFFDDKKGTCSFSGHEKFEKRKVSGVIKYSAPMTVTDFEMIDHSGKNSDFPFRRYQFLKSVDGKVFRDKFLSWVNLEK